jgi:predicted RNA binding protein YcfA (HicA-like mRNA interferase family)
MSKLPVISGAKCVKALEQIGFLVDRHCGSHIILVREDTNVVGWIKF